MEKITKGELDQQTLTKANTNIINAFSEALDRGEAQYIEQYLEGEGQFLQNILAGTQILGFPALAIFTNTDICDGFCDVISRLFVLTCRMPTAHVVSGVSKKLAYDNYENYRKDEWSAHHTWVEFVVDCKTYAIDFADQVIMPADLYYRVFQYKPEELMYKTSLLVAAEGLIDECYVSVAKKMQLIARYTPRLIQEYELLFKDSSYGASTIQKLMQEGMQSTMPSISHMVARAKDYQVAAEIVDADEPIADVIGTMFKMYPSVRYDGEIKLGLEALDKVFDETAKLNAYRAGLKAKAKEICENYQMTIDD